MVTDGKKYLYTEVADNEISRAEGLMFRKYLGSNHAMLFCFASEDYYPFWMKNTYIPLDIAFIDNDGKIVDIRSMSPLSTRRISSCLPFSYALETNHGWFKDNSVKVGYTFGDHMKTSGAETPNWVMVQDFRTCVGIASENHWNMVIDYIFRPVVYRQGNEVPRDFNKPQQNRYQIILDGSTKLPSGKSFEYNDAGNGEYIVVPCFGASGEPRCFFVDGIVGHKYILNGREFVDPREIQVVKKKKKRLPKPGKNPALKGIQSIPF